MGIMETQIDKFHGYILSSLALTAEEEEEEEVTFLPYICLLFYYTIEFVACQLNKATEALKSRASVGSVQLQSSRVIKAKFGVRKKKIDRL